MNIYIGGPVEYDDYSAMQGPCAEGFHIPLSSEWSGLGTIMSGFGFTTGDNWGTYLHIPIAGQRNFNSSATVRYQGSIGYYWSSQQYGDTTKSSCISLFASSFNVNNNEYRALGMSIRGFKDTFVVPTSGWTVITGTLGSAGIFWNTTDGIISITSDGATGYTISDKNLGATTVYNSGDTLSQANCGYYYQWGNNYGFAWTGSVTTSSGQVNASPYGPGNYYSSSTFMCRPSDGIWDSSNNANLRGGVTGVQQKTKSVEVKNIYIGEVYSGPLRFKAEEANSTIQLNKTGSPTTVTLETSTDGNTWSTYTFGTAITLSNIGDKVYFRNTSTTTTGFSTGTSNYYQFAMTGSISCSGSVNYLLNKTGEASLSTWCYLRLFKDCSSLISAPELPSTTLVNNCYAQMFRGCTSLTEAPELPATTMKDGCYNYMFEGCTALTTTPSLPATTLGETCYSGMFEGCSNLETIPALPATELEIMCYTSMFSGCSKIKLSTTQTGEYQTPYRIPTTGTGTTASNALLYMFLNTGGSRSGNPSINTTYYTSNTVV